MAESTNFMLLTFFLLSALLFISAAVSAEEEEFEYEEGSCRGPEHWGELNYPKWKTCADGKRQSPIDIQRENVTVFPKVEALRTRYKAARAVLKNKGHDIMVEWREDAGYIAIGTTKYFLQQTHWHTPSEHRLNNKSYDMEMHMVHKSKDGKVAVIGVLYKIGWIPDKFIQKLGSKLFYLAAHQKKVASVDLGLMKNPFHVVSDYYTYNGSLTTPPCTEGVSWIVAEQVRSVARYQILLLQMAVDPISWNGDAGEIRINGTEYHLKACHWHSPSEHTINGTRYDLELHMVHESDQGQKSVVAILYRFGQHDEFLAMFMHAITTLGTSDEVIGFTNPSDIKFGTKKYYRYEGSLTTPPCTEGVIWNVIKKVRTASKSQIFALRGAVNKGFEKNSRPTQPLNGRTVRLYSPPDTQ
ncbi:unnamed protein product [Victoria cruziana]